MEPTGHVVGKVETEISWFENRTSEIYLYCHLQEENSVMDRYWSWIAQWLEHQHMKLESQIQAPVQDIMFSLSIL